MIKTNELMLGDLVRLTDGQIAKVVAIDATGNVDLEFETGDFLHRAHAQKEDIEPILLTGEILSDIRMGLWSLLAYKRKYNL